MLLPYLNKDLIEAGCDEAGRGCLAGAVYAAACGRIHHLRGFGILVENQYAALSPVTEQLFLDDGEYHAHDQV